VNREELEDERVIIRSARSTHEAVILQLDTGVSFAIVLDDVVWRLKTFWETSIAHGASKFLWARPFRTEAVSFTIMTTPIDISYAAPQAHRIINVAFHWEYSPGIIFIFTQGRKYLYHIYD
jgi:hypothetical protein